MGSVMGSQENGAVSLINAYITEKTCGWGWYTVYKPFGEIKDNEPACVILTLSYFFYKY